MIRRSVAPAAAAAALVLLPGCPKEEPAAKPTPQPYVQRPAAERPVVDEPLRLRFADVTAESGVDFVHRTGADGRKLLPETMGSGCAWLDHDGDGDPDLLLLSGRPWVLDEDPQPTVRLYRNDGGWRFTEVTREAGLGGLAPYAIGVACADADGDGDTDAVVTGIDGYRYLRNDGGRFTSVPKEETGLDPGTWTDATGVAHGPFAASAAFLDHDLDGRPDLFVCHYVHWSEETDVWSTMDGRTKSYAIPTQYAGESCRLWRNLGGGRFGDVTDAAGVRNDEGKSLGVCVADFDGDGRPDIAVANDTQPNYLYLNRGDGTFRDHGKDWNVAYDRNGRARAGMGVDTTTLGAAGRLHLAIGNFSGEPVGVFELRNVAVPQFVECGETKIAEPTLPSLTFGVRWADVDLDGRMDLVLANGHIEPTVQEVHKEIAYRQPVQVLRQGADGRFAVLGADAGEALAVPRVHRSCAEADVDGDGDLDWVFTVNGGAPVLLRTDLEDAAKRSLRVRVLAKSPDGGAAVDALGARVTVEVEGRGPVIRWVASGGGYASDTVRTLTFGLGDSGRAKRVVVRLPDGAERTFTDVPAGDLRVE